jgi:hypothetical protein
LNGLARLHGGFHGHGRTGLIITLPLISIYSNSYLQLQ